MITVNHCPEPLQPSSLNCIGMRMLTPAEAAAAHELTMPIEIVFDSPPCRSHSVPGPDAQRDRPGAVRRMVRFVGNAVGLGLSLFVLDWLFFLVG